MESVIWGFMNKPVNFEVLHLVTCGLKQKLYESTFSTQSPDLKALHVLPLSAIPSVGNIPIKFRQWPVSST